MKKKLAALGTAVLMLAGAFPAINYASNWADTDFSFELISEASSRYAVSINRLKTDDSSVYMKCTSSSRTSTNSSEGGYYGTAHGSSRELGGLADCFSGSKHSETYMFYEGATRYMKNYINETGHIYANIYCVGAKYLRYMNFKGVWSPDSIQ
ncbi:MAG: hypothetical protein HFH63_01700 [Lachnospiraceae bacterium]|nr:hypothetical protein [Lachnospiraceae bacterium]